MYVINFISSASLAAYPRIVDARERMELRYREVPTASITRCMPSAKKSNATTSPARHGFVSRYEAPGFGNHRGVRNPRFADEDRLLGLD